MPRQSSLRVVLLQENVEYYQGIKRGREGRNDRRSVTATSLHSTHVLTAEYTTEWDFKQLFL